MVDEQTPHDTETRPLMPSSGPGLFPHCSNIPRLEFEYKGCLVKDITSKYDFELYFLILKTLIPKVIKKLKTGFL